MARAEGPGRVVSPRRHDLLSEFAGALTGVYAQDELERLRNEWHSSLRLPDALVLATAAQAKPDRLVTRDRRCPSARGLVLTLEITRL